MPDRTPPIHGVAYVAERNRWLEYARGRASDGRPPAMTCACCDELRKFIRVCPSCLRDCCHECRDLNDKCCDCRERDEP